MDCQTARLLLWFRRPNGKELLAEDEAALASHLAACVACADLAQRYRQENRVLGQAIRAVAVPPALSGQILNRIEQVREVSALQAKRRSRTYLATGLTLFLLVIMGAGWWYLRPVPAASLREMEWLGKTRFSLPFSHPIPDKQAWLEQYFYSQQVWFRLPAILRERWDFQHLTAAYAVELQHDRVGVIEFKKEGAHAVVFVVSAARLDPAEIRQYLGSSGYTRLLQSDREDLFSALVVLKEGALEQFLSPPTPPEPSGNGLAQPRPTR